MSQGIHGAGKGDTYRQLDYKKWSEGWDAIFGKKKQTPKKGKSKSKKSKGTK